jgi:starch-binding outer membrane protein, SusD/RagB family
MYFNYKYFYFFAIMLLISASACRKFIEVDPPINRLVANNVFTNNTTANAAQLAIYADMFNSQISYRISAYVAFSADELTSYSTIPEIAQLYSNSLLATTPSIATPWNQGYKYIYSANAVLEGVKGNTMISPDLVKQLTGEALFVRAFWHFYLTNMFGDVPVIVTTDYTINNHLARSPQTEVYEQITKDLIEAQSKLNTNYIDGSGIQASDEKVRPNKWSATALLARVYLYQEKYADAVNQASSVIDSEKYSLVSDLDGVFLKNNTEALWQLQTPTPATRNTYEGQYFILTAAPGNGAQLNATLSDQLLTAFETNDNRKTQWTNIITVSNADYIYPFKYKIRTGSSVTEYATLLRLAEQYLIRAEAYAQENDANNAVADLNEIRNRAGLSDYNGSLDKDSIINAVFHERQVELFTEWGHRWFDLKRTGNVHEVMSVIAPLKGGAWSSFKQLYPIPQNEINNNASLKQTQGY